MNPDEKGPEQIPVPPRFRSAVPDSGSVQEPQREDEQNQPDLEPKAPDAVREVSARAEEEPSAREGAKKVDVQRPARSEDETLDIKSNLLNSLELIGNNFSGIWVDDKSHEPSARALVDSEYRKMQENAYALTGESLNKKVRQQAKVEAEKDGKKVLTRKEFFSGERIAQQEKEETKRRIGAGVKVSWGSLSDAEKQKYTESKGSVSAGMKQYARDLEARRQELKKDGIDIPLDVYYNALYSGAEPQKAKRKGLFGGRVIINYSQREKDGKLVNPVFFDGKRKDFNAWADIEEHNLMLSIANDVRGKMADKYIIGRQKLFYRKIDVLSTIAKDITEKDTGAEVTLAGKKEEFRTVIASEKIDSELDALPDDLSIEQLDKKIKEAKETLEGRAKKLGDLIDSNEGSAILSALKLTPEEVADFKKSVQKGSGNRSEKIPVNFWNALMQKRFGIEKDHDILVEGVNSRRKKALQQEAAKALAEIREKIASI